MSQPCNWNSSYGSKRRTEVTPQLISTPLALERNTILADPTSHGKRLCHGVWLAFFVYSEPILSPICVLILHCIDSFASITSVALCACQNRSHKHTASSSRGMSPPHFMYWRCSNVGVSGQSISAISCHGAPSKHNCLCSTFQPQSSPAGSLCETSCQLGKSQTCKAFIR